MSRPYVRVIVTTLESEFRRGNLFIYSVALLTDAAIPRGRCQFSLYLHFAVTIYEV